MKTSILTLLPAAAALVFPCTAPPSHAAQPEPNILFIMIDDLGWMDLACQGNQLVETPNIDDRVFRRWNG